MACPKRFFSILYLEPNLFFPHQNPLERSTFSLIIQVANVSAENTKWDQPYAATEKYGNERGRLTFKKMRTCRAQGSHYGNGYDGSHLESHLEATWNGWASGWASKGHIKFRQFKLSSRFCFKREKGMLFFDWCPWMSLFPRVLRHRTNFFRKKSFSKIVS